MRHAKPTGLIGGITGAALLMGLSYYLTTVFGIQRGWRLASMPFMLMLIMFAVVAIWKGF